MSEQLDFLKDEALPAGINQGFDADPDVVWKTLEGSDRRNAASRVDLALLVATEEKKQDVNGWRARTAIRLGLDEKEGTLNTLATLVKVGDTFRRPPPYGLGWTRDKLVEYPIQKLRVFSSHTDWSKRHPERVEELLKNPEINENEARAIVAEAVKVEKNQQVDPKTEEIKFSMMSMQIQTDNKLSVDQMIKEEMAFYGQNYPFSTLPSRALGELFTLVLATHQRMRGAINEAAVEAGGDAPFPDALPLYTMTPEEMHEASMMEEDPELQPLFSTPIAPNVQFNFTDDGQEDTHPVWKPYDESEYPGDA